MDTNNANGIGRLWVDGNPVADEVTVNYSEGNSTTRNGIKFMDFHDNQSSPGNGGPKYVDIDDMAIWKVTPPNTDSFGNPWIGPLNGFSGAGALPKPMPPEPFEVSFYDSIEDSNFASLGWYEKTSMVLINSGATSRSTKSIEYRFNSGASQAMR